MQDAQADHHAGSDGGGWSAVCLHSHLQATIHRANRNPEVATSKRSGVTDTGRKERTLPPGSWRGKSWQSRSERREAKTCNTASAKKSARSSSRSANGCHRSTLCLERVSSIRKEKLARHTIQAEGRWSYPIEQLLQMVPDLAQVRRTFRHRMRSFQSVSLIESPA